MDFTTLMKMTNWVKWMLHAKHEIIGNKNKINDMHDIIPYGSKWLIWSIDMDEHFHIDEIDDVEWYDYMNKID